MRGPPCAAARRLLAMMVMMMMALLVALPRGSLGDCPFPPILDDAVIKDKFNDLRYFRVGLVVEYICRHRYSKVPGINITCTEKSQWSEPKISCKVTCEDPVVEHGIKLSGFGPLYTYGENITFECKIGYFMVGSYLIRCEENGTWYPDIPSCKKIDPALCGAPLILSGTVHPFEPHYMSGMIITITCNLHYSFPDDTVEMTTVCQGYNVWNPPVQPCLYFFLVLLITACLFILLWLPALSVYQKYCK